MPRTASPEARNVQLLELLLGKQGYCTIDALARQVRTSETQITQGIERLRSQGCVIDAHPQQGVRLLRTGLSVWADYIEPRHAGRIGARLKVFRQTASTQELAKQIVRGDPLGSLNDVILADEQTAGRGRLGRRWHAPAGSSLLLTAIARPEAATLDRLMLGSCSALAQTLETLGLTPEVRWPNDVLIGDEKVAGILVEVIAGTAVVGIGLNALDAPRHLPAEEGFAPRATSLAAHGVSVDRLAVLDDLLDELHHALYHADDQTLREAWRRRSCLTRRRVTVAVDGKRLTGQVIDIDPLHGLLMQVEHGPVVTLPAETTSLLATA